MAGSLYGWKQIKSEAFSERCAARQLSVLNSLKLRGCGLGLEMFGVQGFIHVFPGRVAADPMQKGLIACCVFGSNFTSREV